MHKRGTLGISASLQQVGPKSICSLQLTCNGVQVDAAKVWQDADSRAAGAAALSEVKLGSPAARVACRERRITSRQEAVSRC
jgi:hypothetical protein